MAVASKNMKSKPCSVSTIETSQPEMSWLKAEAQPNMPFMVVTELVFHAPIGWLKAEAWMNMPPMIVTELVFQAPIGWLKGWLRRTRYPCSSRSSCSSRIDLG